MRARDWTADWLQGLGRLTLLTRESIASLLTFKVAWQDLLYQIYFVGVKSQSVLGPEGTNVIITVRIYKDYQIHKDAEFVILSSGFLGDQYIAVLPTRNADGVFQEGDETTCEAPVNIQEVTRSAGSALKRVDVTINELNAVIDNVRRLALNEQTLTNLSETVANVRVATAHAVTAVDNINMLVESNRPAIGGSISNLLSFSDRLDHVADGVNDVIATNSPAISTAVSNLAASTATLKALLDDVQAGKGTAGKLLKDEQIAANLSQITSNLSITTSNLNRLGLWRILWKHKAARTEESTAPAPVLTPPKNRYD